MTHQVIQGIPHKRVGKDCGNSSRTHQSFKDDCDVNVVMKRFANNGVMPMLNTRGQPQYGDFSNATTYLEARVAVIDAMADFMDLPSAVRTACDNDPGKFLEMCADPERTDELVELGLKPADIPPKVVQVEVVNPPEPAGEEGE